jgi:hypothetical protein
MIYPQPYDLYCLNLKTNNDLYICSAFFLKQKAESEFSKGAFSRPMLKGLFRVPTHSSSRNPSSTGGWLPPPVRSAGLSITQRSPSDRPSSAWPPTSLATQTAESATKCHSTAYKSRRRRSLRSGQDSLSSTGSSRCPSL